MLSNPSHILRRITFDESERVRLLFIIKVMLDAGMAVSQVFKSLAEQGQNPQTRHLGTLAQEGYSEHGTYTGGWENQGYWSATEFALIHSAEKQGELAKVGDDLASLIDPERSLLKAVIVPSGVWIISALMMVALLLGLLTQEKILVDIGGGDIKALEVAHWLYSNGVILLAALGGIFAAYLWLRRHMTGVRRNLVKKAQVFGVYDRQFGATVARVLAALIEQGTPRADALGSCAQIYRNHPQQRAALKAALTDVNQGMGFSVALTDVLYPAQSALLRLMAPGDEDKSLSAGLRYVALMLDDAIDQRFTELRVLVQIGSLSVVFAIALLLFPLLLGGFAQPTY